MNRLINISNVSYCVESGKTIISRTKPKYILKDINFDINESEFLAVAGPSGSGKSTLAKIISGIIQPSAGEIIFESIKPDEIQILFQNNNELINPNRKVEDIVNESINIANSKRDSLQIKKEDILNLLEIPESLFAKRGFELSGGQRQKVGLARVLFQNPKLLILDEPFAAQDYEVVEKIKHLLSALLSDYKISIICISHLTRHFSGYNGRILYIENGMITKIDTLDCKTSNGY